jgi:hypothetical protein
MIYIKGVVLFLVIIYSCIINSLSLFAEEKSMPQNRTVRFSSKVKITFVYLRQPGMASNQFAVWIEDKTGKFIKTLYATRFTAKGGWKNRPDSLPTWVEAAQAGSLSNGQIDSVTGATPPAGDLTYLWDCKDNNGNLVPADEYRYCVEGSVRWKSRVLYTGTIKIGGSAQQSTAVRDVYGDDEEEWNMITNVAAEYYP